MNKSQNQLGSLTVVSTKNNDYKQNMSINSWFNKCIISALRQHEIKNAIFNDQKCATHLIIINGYILVVSQHF